MKTNRIFSKEILPYKIFPKKDHWLKVLFSGNGFHYGGIEITHRVTAWTPLSKKELQIEKGHKELTKKEKVLISSFDEKKIKE